MAIFNRKRKATDKGDTGMLNDTLNDFFIGFSQYIYENYVQCEETEIDFKKDVKDLLQVMENNQ